ncbi:MAG TPA: Uma2 family endonuclease [Candidatus Aquilonibacter sp.]|nr:Uma2 family endonuclease [Candidatus Aquilonibacter sp.]
MSRAKRADKIENLQLSTRDLKLNPVSKPYEEILDGMSLPRSAPDVRHEMICDRLHAAMMASVANLSTTQLLAPRTRIQVSRATAIRPDLALLTTATQKLFLAVEIITRGDHNADTVVKKEIYEQICVPRLWMVDPRYDNVEIYHSTEWGLKLQGILAGSEILSEQLIPEFQMVIVELFAAAKAD